MCSRLEIPDNVKYVLDFGAVCISETKRVMFKICNQSTINLYRFEWISDENITLNPIAGHLSPGHDKDIVASFCSNQHHQIINKVLTGYHINIKFPINKT